MKKSEYKKRGQAGWNGRKTAKEISKYKERQFSKTEIKQEMQEHLEGDEYRYRHKKSPTPNEKARLEYNLSLYKKWAAAAKARGEMSGWCGYHTYLSDIEKIEKQIEEFDKKQEKL